MNNEHNNKPETYKIMVDHKPYDWPNSVISGAEIKQLTGVDDQTFDVWMDVQGPEDDLIENTTQLDLTKPGVEKFYTIKKTTTEG